MVGIGKPSGGCGVCRRRHIKCDERKPSCSYCIKTEQLCPGYKHAFDLAWRDQNSVAKKSVERRKKLADKRSTPQNEGCIELMSQFLFPKQEDLSLTFFFTSYARKPINPMESNGFMQHIAPLYLTAAPESTIRLSILSIATFLRTAWSNRRPDTPLVRSFYLRALSAMKEQVSSAICCSDNEMLISVLLLQFYENLNGTVKQYQSPRAHLDGALAIVRHRGRENFNDDTSKSLLFFMRNLLINESFRQSQCIHEDVKDWLVTLPDRVPSNQLGTINIDLVNLQAYLRLVSRDSSGIKVLAPEIILHRALDIEQRLLGWEADLPNSWLATKVTGNVCISPSIARAGLYQSHCDLYPSIAIAGTFNTYRISLVRTLVIKNTYASKQPSTLTNFTTRAACHNLIQRLADDICASVPFHLGDRVSPGPIGDKTVQYPHALGKQIDEDHYLGAQALAAWQMLGPFEALLGLNLKLRSGQKEWICKQMMRLAQVYNLGK